ncbi:MAG: hypothetical protein JWO86_7438 [Myxococcaceae bacterium]|nr:hypothetical protein [Myxococcaceae bacterium]MEA2748525.1 hypothetical protein [Myxococcales bacterium]
MRCLSACVGLYIVMLSSTALAQETPRPGRDLAQKSTEASCRYARAVAESTSSVMMSPQLFATGGLVSGSESPTGPTTTTVQPRLIGGVQYGAATLYRGIQTRALAEAECKTFAVFNKLLAFSFVNGTGESAPALRARLKVLEDARTHAEEILKRARDGVADARMTNDDLDVTASRIDAFRAATVETRQRLHSAEGAMLGPEESVETLLAQRDVAERAAEDRAARIRQSLAWDVSVRAGYDQIYGQHQPVPLFGVVTVTFSPGLFWQRPADDRAEVARVDAARAGLENASLRAEETARQLRELVRGDRERLVDVTTLLSELETRYDVVSKVPGDKALASADLLWLGMVTLRAEKAYLAAHIVDLAKTLHEPATTVR